jgi:hypothetical protein
MLSIFLFLRKKLRGEILKIFQTQNSRTIFCSDRDNFKIMHLLSTFHEKKYIQLDFHKFLPKSIKIIRISHFWNSPQSPFLSHPSKIFNSPQRSKNS